MIRNVFPPALGVLLLASGAVFAQAGGPATAPAPIPGSFIVTLMSQNASGLSGSATLSPQGQQTRVEINLTGDQANSNHPAHIHSGSCAQLDPKPKYGLENVRNGKSTTIVPVPLATLAADTTAINVHKGTDDIQTYVACGNVKRPA